MKPVDHDEVIRNTVEWLEKAVIGLNFCPFAKAVHTTGRIRYRVSDADSEDALVRHLLEELDTLCAARADVIDTTLLIHPCVLNDFLAYNDFLGLADDLVARAGLEGIIQIASFHPQYCFADSRPEDVANYTNRSPYPMLHLLREESVGRAVDSCVDTHRISTANIQKLNGMGLEGWKKLWAESDKND